MKIAVLLVVSTLISIHSAHANKEAGNGGGAFICPHATQSEFLDLFEARIPGIVTEAGLVISPSSLSVDEQIQNAFARLNVGSTLYKKILSTYEDVRRAKIFQIPDGVEIAWPSDEYNQLIKSGCAPRGVMLYNDNSQSILQDAKALSSLPALQQAAAWVHETIYKFFRDTQKASDSIQARKVVGHLFSSETPDQLRQSLIDVAQLNPAQSYVLEEAPPDGQFPNWGVPQAIYRLAYPWDDEEVYLTLEVKRLNTQNCDYNTIDVNTQIDSPFDSSRSRRYTYNGPFKLFVHGRGSDNGDIARIAISAVGTCQLQVSLSDPSGRTILLPPFIPGATQQGTLIDVHFFARD